LTESGVGPLLPRQRRRPKRGVRLLPWLVRIVGIAIVFAAGVALGQALESDSGSGETQTSIRTLVPETLPAHTVTVTVTTP
jgi:hypothetical protein